MNSILVLVSLWFLPDKHRSVTVLMTGSSFPSHSFLISNKRRNPTPHSSPTTTYNLRSIIRAEGPISRWAITMTKSSSALFDGGRWSERCRKEGLWDYDDGCVSFRRKYIVRVTWQSLTFCWGKTRGTCQLCTRIYGGAQKCEITKSTFFIISSFCKMC